MSQGASLPPRPSAKECNQALLTAAVPSYFPPLDKWTDNEFLRLFSQCWAVLDRCALYFLKIRRPPFPHVGGVEVAGVCWVLWVVEYSIEVDFSSLVEHTFVDTFVID